MQFLAVIFESYTLYSPITKNEPTAHGKLKRKAERNIPRWNTQKKDTVEKKRPGRQGREQANRAEKEKFLNGQFQFKQFFSSGQRVVKKNRIFFGG